MAEIELHTETVKDGEKAKWPFETGYSNPSKNGYLFDGWEYKGRTYKPPYEEAENPFGPITENTDIKAKWDKLTIHADTNHTIISGDGDTDADLTKLMYWVSSDSGLMITSGVTIEDVPLDSDDMLPIIFDGAGSTAVVDNKNVKTVKVKENDINKPRYYRFKSKYSIAELTSDIVEIKQAGKDQTILPPFDYLTFTYNWTAEDGIDLDSATIIRNSHLPITAHTTLDDYFVGYSGTNTNPTVTQYLQYGGDNQTSGDEGAMVNWKKVCDHDFISEGITTLYLDIYANWYVEKGNGKMSISFKTYKGNDGLVKNGFIFEPTGDTVQVSDTMLSNLYVNAQSNQNAYKGVNGVKNFYSKIATVEYDIRTKSAVLIGEYSQSGRDAQAEVTFNGATCSCINGLTVSIHIDKNPNSGTVTLSSIRQTINGVSYIAQLRVDNVTIRTSYYDGTEGIPDDYVTYTVSNNSDGGININWNCAQNNSGSNHERNCDIIINFTSSQDLSYTFKYCIYQSAT